MQNHFKATYQIIIFQICYPNNVQAKLIKFSKIRILLHLVESLHLVLLCNLLVLSQITFKPKTELTLKEAPILKCHLIDTHKETTVIAEIPLKVSLDAYYARYGSSRLLDIKDFIKFLFERQISY